MPEREEGSELSEETRRLVDDLGKRLSEEASPPMDDSRFDVLQRSAVEDDALFQRMPVDDVSEPAWALEEKLGDLDAEISHAEQDLRRLQEMREYLQRQLGGARDQAGIQRERMARSPFPELPEYLEPVGVAIGRQSPGSFWLHGEDARERRRAVEALTDLLGMDARAGWVVADVDFADGGRRPSSAPPVGVEIAHIVREAWDSWGPGRRPYGLCAFHEAVSRSLADGHGPGGHPVGVPGPAAAGDTLPRLAA